MEMICHNLSNMGIKLSLYVSLYDVFSSINFNLELFTSLTFRLLIILLLSSFSWITGTFLCNFPFESIAPYELYTPLCNLPLSRNTLGVKFGRFNSSSFSKLQWEHMQYIVHKWSRWKDVSINHYLHIPTFLAARYALNIQCTFQEIHKNPPKFVHGSTTTTRLFSPLGLMHTFGERFESFEKKNCQRHDCCEWFSYWDILL